VAAAGAPPNIDRWESGLAWVQERCGAPYRLVPVCDEPEVDYDAPRASTVYYQPVGLDVADECSTMGGPLDPERVRRVAEATFPFAAARELWTGAGTLADPYDVGGQSGNAYLASPEATVIGSSTAPPLVALGRLEQAAMEASHGQAVMLHVPLTLSWQLAPSLFRVGTSYLTVAGNVVVADGGYPGTGPGGEPAGATVWAYATSPVAVLASDLEVVADPAETVDRSTNTQTTWAKRVFAVTFDPCVHLATEVTL